MTLGQIIKAYRETNSMSMDDFSKASKISKGYISQLENNLNPTACSVYSIYKESCKRNVYDV